MPHPAPPPDVCLLEARPLVAAGLAALLERSGLCTPREASEPPELISLVRSCRPRLLLLGAGSTPALFQWLAAASPRTPAVVLGRWACAEPPLPAEQGTWSWLEGDTATAGQLLEAVRAALSGQRPAPARFEGRPVTPHKAVLSAREAEVLAWVATGADNLTIATCLGISERTVRAHVSALYEKLGGENRAQLALRGRAHGVQPAAGY